MCALSHYLVRSVLCVCLCVCVCVCVCVFVCVTSQAISTVTGNKKCVENIAEANVLQFVLLVLYMLPSCESHVM